MPIMLLFREKGKKLEKQTKNTHQITHRGNSEIGYVFVSTDKRIARQKTW